MRINSFGLSGLQVQRRVLDLLKAGHFDRQFVTSGIDIDKRIRSTLIGGQRPNSRGASICEHHAGTGNHVSGRILHRSQNASKCRLPECRHSVNKK